MTKSYRHASFIGLLTAAMLVIVATPLLSTCSPERSPVGTASPASATSPTSATSPASSATTSVAALPADMPSDFQFIAERGIGRMNVLDTAAATYTKDLVGESPPTATTRLSLTRDEMRMVYERLRALDPWSYPSDFQPPYADVTEPGVEQSASNVVKYHLWLRAAGMERDIWWIDESGSSAAKAEALREWFRQLWYLIENKPEYKALPPAVGGYA